METSDSDANHAVLQAKTTEEGWNQYRLDILVQIRPFLIAQKGRWGLGPIETCNSWPKLAVWYAKTADEDWDP